MDWQMRGEPTDRHTEPCQNTFSRPGGVVLSPRMHVRWQLELKQNPADTQFLLDLGPTVLHSLSFTVSHCPRCVHLPFPTPKSNNSHVTSFPAPNSHFRAKWNAALTSRFFNNLFVSVRVK